MTSTGKRARNAKVTVTSTATAVNASDAAVLKPFDKWLKGWPKAAGAKPTAANFKAALALGLKPATTKALAMAMYFRVDGATSSEVSAAKRATHAPEVNVWSTAVKAKQVVAVDVAPRNGKVYKVAMPAAKAKRAPRTAAKAQPVETKPQA